MILSKEQRIGASILFAVAFAAWIGVAIWPSRQGRPNLPEPSEQKRQRTWEERKDSMRRADSLRYVQWAAERELRYDSFRLADSLRRVAWKENRKAQYDSFRLEDSLWRDSVGWKYIKHEKRDTILDLNKCDTSDLQLIRGIGHYTAVQIIRYREQLGGFYSTEQLKDEFFSKLRLDTLGEHFTVDPADIEKIPVNSCSIQQLQQHPYLRYEQAKAIYSLRRKKLRLDSPEDLLLLPELTPDDVKRITMYLSFE